MTAEKNFEFGILCPREELLYYFSDQTYFPYNKGIIFLSEDGKFCLQSEKSCKKNSTS